MNNNLKDAFGSIHATEEMKQNTTEFLRSKISGQQRRTRRALRYAVICCAMLFMAVCGLGGYVFYQTPVSYISIDVNPSVELGLNRFDRVVTVKAYNEDGHRVLEDLDIKNKSYQEAVELLLSDTTFEGYLNDDSLLSFTVVSDKQESLMDGIKQCEGYGKVSSECHGASEEVVEEAHHSGLSFGKYQAYQELAKYDDTITPEDCHHLSMRELKKRISEYTGEDVDIVDEDDGEHHEEADDGEHHEEEDKDHHEEETDRGKESGHHGDH
ncbi:anti-sigma-I factor RsgI family protein [Anaerolentibacter hominis]|uniref:anti-sigma-I factor RsgI family protein n=1 Tax=Anaerolentibacter hominis TaxID=3079009 RepID=UPI0031B869C7